MLLLTSLIAILIALGTHRKYKTILLDPPWDINQKGKLGAINHYDLMTLDQIRNLPIPELAADNAHLWLWVPNGLVPEAIQLVKDWGFTYRNSFYWIKPRLGLGVYLRNASETVIFATRGKAPVQFKSQPNWLFAPYKITHISRRRCMTLSKESRPARTLNCSLAVIVPAGMYGATRSIRIFTFLIIPSLSIQTKPRSPAPNSGQRLRELTRRERDDVWTISRNVCWKDFWKPQLSSWFQRTLFVSPPATLCKHYRF